ncbi:hypothetical protein GSI_08993 [Ganoderma sinense ZZ0214-1]|uniref:Transporter n=1 Tax=Ganoderma sinense ZZ0214-1 TaxID=1077348 RepID=A0A2G8S587_9APHY|nr:hypothetical protein GSI_08993 [Ganoderma sinense ZZ0214-1]
MLSRAVVFFFAFLSLFVNSQIYAAPTREIASRQLGTIGCELARTGVSLGLSTLNGILTTVESQVTDNAALSTVIQTVLGAVSSAESAISSLGSATSASDALSLVQTNIAAVETALSSLTNSTSSDIGANIEKALEQIASTALADALSACQ